jgi:hypothetical protein
VEGALYKRLISPCEMIIGNGRKEIHASEPEALVDEEPVISKE